MYQYPEEVIAVLKTIDRGGPYTRRSNVLSPMVKAGYIRITEKTPTGRIRSVELTHIGRALLAADAVDMFAEKTADLFDSLVPSDIIDAY